MHTHRKFHVHAKKEEKKGKGRLDEEKRFNS